jgi:alginate O-acetyltransferase complex protein AlgI
VVFSSPTFAFLFLPLVILTYIVVGQTWKNAILLAFSILFYAWGEGTYALIMLASILANWLFGLALDRSARTSARNAFLALAVAANLGALLTFKYANFIIENFNLVAAGVVGEISPIGNVPWHLPLGISFFTFHSLSYVIDVYRGVARAQRSLFTFALYISFFPQLVAGPIIRYHDIADQLVARRTSLEKFASGVERFTLGFGKKVLIANPMGSVADQIFALSSADLSTPVAWLGIVAYAFQIYFDFSGYSDMAIGLGRMFGFEFLENFNYPYIARSIREFWQRWHISLSNWFREYLYIPLGGNRHGTARTCVNLFTVFLLCGFWHGASWNFMIWGLLHGGMLALERTPLGQVIARLPRLLAHAYVLLGVLVAWVFFRADTLAQAVDFLSCLFVPRAAQSAAWPVTMFLDTQTVVLLCAAAVGSTPALSMLARDWLARRSQVRGAAGELAPTPSPFDGALAALRPAFMAVTLILSATYLAGNTYNPFIYFRF